MGIVDVSGEIEEVGSRDDEGDATGDATGVGNISKDTVGGEIEGRMRNSRGSD